MKIVIECGQSFWSWRSWAGCLFRKLRYNQGFAVGPVIVIWRKRA